MNDAIIHYTKDEAIKLEFKFSTRYLLNRKTPIYGSI